MTRGATHNLGKLRRAHAIHFHQLRYAVAAADHGSFRSAAESLLVRQATLSSCVRQLEHAIGTALFERYSGGVRLTRFGQTFLEVARSIIEQVDSLITTGLLTERGESGRLSVGFYTSLSTGNLLASVVEYRQQFPLVDTEMIERSRSCLTAFLHNRTIDVAIVPGERALVGAQSMPLWSERIVAVLPKNHRLAESQAVSWTDLGNETLLLSRQDPGPAIHECLITRLASPEARPEIEWHDVSRESINSMVGEYMGIGLTLETSLGTNSDGVVYREIQDGAGSTRIGLSVNWRKDNESPALANFLNLLKQRYPSSF